MAGATASVGGTKRRRVTRACDRCHNGGLKCEPDLTNNSCSHCLAWCLECTYNRPVKRRGPVPNSWSKEPARLSQPNRPQEFSASISSPEWVYHGIVDHQTILYLADIYYCVVYPILHYFHWPTFSADLRAQRYVYDRSFYSLTMAVCATASARKQASALLYSLPPSVNLDMIPSSMTFFKECLDSIPSLVVGKEDFNLMRTEALLGMLSLQHDDLGGCHAHLHQYLAMATQSGFHDEANWPSNLKETEVQERRRLFWQCYHFDIYLAVTFGSPMRQREAQSCVFYPAEIFDDQDITESQTKLPKNGTASFIRGWNLVTDLYRLLERIMETMQTRPTSQTHLNRELECLFSSVSLNRNRHVREDIVATTKRLFDELPIELRSARPMTGDVIHDRHGFQAANIIVTMTTVKMVTARFEDQSVAHRCAIVGELLDGLSSIPTFYIQATSSAMLYHVAGIGHLLSAVIRSPLSQWECIQVRSALLAMAGLVSSLESALNLVADISSKIREHVQRINQHMSERSRSGGENHVFHNALPTPVDVTTPVVGAITTRPAQDNDQRSLQVTDKDFIGLAPPDTALLSSGFDSTITHSPARVPNPRNFNLEALPRFQLPIDTTIGWPFGLDFGGAFDHLGNIDVHL